MTDDHTLLEMTSELLGVPDERIEEISAHIEDKFMGGESIRMIFNELLIHYKDNELIVAMTTFGMLVGLLSKEVLK